MIEEVNNRRKAERFPLRAKGLMQFQGWANMVKFQTLDVSTEGMGARHDDRIPPKGTIGRLQLTLILDGIPTSVESHFEIRFSCLSQNSYRSGLLFKEMSPEHKLIVLRALRGMLPLVDV